MTGNFETIGWLKLERGGIRNFFDFGSFSDTREKREDIFRHGVELARKLRGPEATVCVVGDTPNDIWAAANVGHPGGRGGDRHLFARRPGEGRADGVRDDVRRVADGY